MKVTNWGNYPVIEAEVFTPSSDDEVRAKVVESQEIIARGLGRCYGDSSLGRTILSTARLNHFLAFDETAGVLTCEAGVSLAEILEAFVPRGWFLPVTPGTKFVTVGGAIAADVHGKNHHVAGSFSSHILSMSVMVSDGSIVECSKDANSDLFWATCGGMGLTGIILKASFRLSRIETAYIRQRVIKAKNLDEVFDAFEANKHWTYSVAWIDCLARGRHLGRSALMCGEHALSNELGSHKSDPLTLPKKLSLSVPVFFPDFALNSFTVKLFNAIRFHTFRNGDSLVDYDTFFYPLDSIFEWNKIYGRRGFTQYQFVLPKDSSKEGLKRILEMISESGEGSFLAVLKLFGKQDGLLSFPREGYTLALDFPITSKVLSLLDRLDDVVLAHGGRLYLAKDVRMSPEMMRKGYDTLERFASVRTTMNAASKFNSLQSRRVGL